MDMYLISFTLEVLNGKADAWTTKEILNWRPVGFLTCDLMVAENLNSNFDAPSLITSTPWEASITGDINNRERQ